MTDQTCDQSNRFSYSCANGRRNVRFGLPVESTAKQTPCFKMSWSTTRSQCLGCRQGFEHRPTHTIISFCPECSLTQLDAKDAEIKRLRSDLGMVQSRLQFLCPQKELHNELVHGILKSDVMIIVQGKRDESLVAHKFVLSTRSSVFCKMFDANMLEGETGTVLIDDASHDVVKSVIKFCYDAEIDFISDGISAEEVLEVAHKYDIGLLQKRCEQEMSTTISCENLPKMFKIAKKFGLRDLERAASQFLKDHYDTDIASVLTEILP